MWQQFQQQLVQAAPWLDSFWPWYENAKTVWHAVESLVLLGGLFWISHRLKAERLKMTKLVGELGDDLDERVETFGQFAKAARDAAETAADSRPSGASVEVWPTLRAEWFEMRDRIELAIENIKHKSVRGKYAKIDRRNYWNVISTLQADGIISPGTATALINMNQCYMTFRNRSAEASGAHLQQMRAWAARVNGTLPRPPKDTPPPGGATSLPVAAE